MNFFINIQLSLFLGCNPLVILLLQLGSPWSSGFSMEIQRSLSLYLFIFQIFIFIKFVLHQIYWALMVIPRMSSCQFPIKFPSKLLSLKFCSPLQNFLFACTNLPSIRIWTKSMMFLSLSSAGTYSSVFDYCTGRCRHSSESVVI